QHHSNQGSHDSLREWTCAMRESANCPRLRDKSPLTDDPVCPSYPYGEGDSGTTSKTTDERGALTDSPVCNKVARAAAERSVSTCPRPRRLWQEQGRSRHCPSRFLDISNSVFEPMTAADEDNGQPQAKGELENGVQ